MKKIIICIFLISINCTTYTIKKVKTNQSAPQKIAISYSIQKKHFPTIKCLEQQVSFYFENQDNILNQINNIEDPLEKKSKILETILELKNVIYGPMTISLNLSNKYKKIIIQLIQMLNEKEIENLPEELHKLDIE